MTLLSRVWRCGALAALLGVLASACAADRPTLEDNAASREVDESVPASTPAIESVEVGPLRVAVGRTWNGDPGAAGPAALANRVVAGLLFEGLTRLDRSGEPEPALAERWQVSDDRLRWTFVLPDALTDGGGRMLTARDVKASLERLAERGAHDQVVAQLSPIAGWDALVAGESGGAAGIVAPDDQTLVIELDAPFEPLAAVLAEPAYGVTGVAADGSTRTTGAYTFGSTMTELVAVDAAAPVQRIELIVAEQTGGELLQSGVADWAVLDADDEGAAIAGTVLRQPLPLRVGLVIRLDDPGQRHAIAGALNPPELALELDNATAAIAPVVAPRQDQLPATLHVLVPQGPLASLQAELTAQLTAAGVTPTVRVVDQQAFAEAVAAGESGVFPIVLPGAGFSRSVGLVATDPGSRDDAFGVRDLLRTDLVDELLAEADADARSILVTAVEDRLRDEHLWLPIANIEVRVGLSARMAPIRVLADGTFDLSGF